MHASHLFLLLAKQHGNNKKQFTDVTMQSMFHNFIVALLLCTLLSLLKRFSSATSRAKTF